MCEAVHSCAHGWDSDEACDSFRDRAVTSRTGRDDPRGAREAVITNPFAPLSLTNRLLGDVCPNWHENG